MRWRELLQSMKSRQAPVLAGLLLLGIIPMLAGAARLAELERGVATAENSRFLASPWPVTIHILCASIFALLGPLQLMPGNSKRSPRWHRGAGAILLACGFVVAGTGLWMTLFSPGGEHDGRALYWLRILVGTLMTASMAASVAAIWRRDFLSHRDWMVRAYALALGAGSQVLTHIPWLLLASWHGEAFRFLCMAAGWGVNVVVAEWVIWRWRAGPRDADAMGES